jgi:hypothetical protein
MVGGSSSFTVIVNEQEAEFPEVSVAVQVTVVVPTGKNPGPGVQKNVGSGQLSETVGSG